jgi:hypothetical protein
MRLWSLHPRYLDPQGLVAVWREALLAQAVLAGRTRGYRDHPQLIRFRQSPAPRRYIAAYLRLVHAEASRRGYAFDAARIARQGRQPLEALAVSRGQLQYEWAHLLAKLRRRAPERFAELRPLRRPRSHPLFRVAPGGIADWEVGAR